MTTYTVDATELQGVILCFQLHNEASLPRINHTFNAVYGIDLYDSDFHFTFDNVETNGLKELYKDTLDCLLVHMVHHIKQESGATIRHKTKKVDTLLFNV